MFNFVSAQIHNLCVWYYNVTVVVAVVVVFCCRQWWWGVFWCLFSDDARCLSCRFLFAVLENHGGWLGASCVGFVLFRTYVNACHGINSWGLFGFYSHCLAFCVCSNLCVSCGCCFCLACRASGISRFAICRISHCACENMFSSFICECVVCDGYRRP